MKKDILIFGDSIAYGVGDPELGGWADKLKRFVWEKKPNLNVYNFCIDGNSTKEILERLRVQSSQTLYPKEAIFIAIGINDSISYPNGEKFMEQKDFEKNLREIINQSKEFTKNIYIIGLTSVDENLTAPFGNSRTGKSFLNSEILKFDNILKKVSKENKAQYIDMKNLLKNSDLFDGLHVNPKGQQKMFNKILEQIDFL